VKKLLPILMVLMLAGVLTACSGQSAGTSGSSDGEIPDRTRVVIGSTSTGGDTYQNSDTASRYLEDVLGTNMKVDAVGAVQAFSELAKADTDGSTIMFFHDMAYLGVEYGSIDEKNALENWKIGPVVSTNPGNAFLTSADAPYDTMAESAEWLKNNPDETITIAIEAGGVSEISFDGYYLWVKEEYGTEVSDRIKVYPTGSQEDKNQALWDGNADIINGSIGGNNEFTKDGVDSKIKMKFLGITAGKRVEGYDIPTFAEQGIAVNGKEFVFDKEFFILLPKDIDSSFVKALDEAVAEVVENPDYVKDLAKNAYIPSYISAEEAEDYLLEKRSTFQNIINNAPTVDELTE
jgi:tripartite-type tricarboxylate transporter receptor subunit TctC